MRKTYLDNIRWITVVIVALYHVIYMYNGEVVYGVIGPFADNQPQDIFQYIVYPWFMLLLFVVSGMAARFEIETKSSKEFIRKRTRKLLVPSTIGLLVFQWILGYYNITISGAIEQFAAIPKPFIYLICVLSGTGPLWYIQSLWLFSLVLVLIRKIEKDRLYRLCEKVNILILVAMAVLIWGSAQILNMPLIVCYRFGIYGVGFFIGYFVLSHDCVMEKVERQWLLLSILAFVSGLIFAIMYWKQPYAEHVVLDTPVCNLFAWYGTLGVLAFMKKWGDFENAFSKWMNKKAWGLYVFHYMTIAICAFYLNKFATQTPVIIHYILTGVAAFGGAFVLNELISRIPVFRWCVLGIKKEK